MRIIFAIKRWYFKLEFMKSIIIVAYLTSSMAIPAMVIMLYRTASVVVIKFQISRILIPIVVILFIIVVVVMPLMSVVFSCHKVIETPQQSSKAVVNTSNGCLHCPKLGVGGKLCGRQHTNPLICDLYISINSLRVLLHLTYQSLNNTLRARGLWWRVLIIIRRTCHVEVHKTKKKRSEEERKRPSTIRTLLQGTHTQLAHTSSYQFLPCFTQDGEGNQQVSNLEEGVSVLARESL
jgi:hypothetical protein